MKANHIYLRRLRDNDFEERNSEELEIRGTTIEDLAKITSALRDLISSKNTPKPSFEKGGITTNQK